MNNNPDCSLSEIAQEQLQSLKYQDIIEIASYKNPSDLIFQIMKDLNTLLQRKCITEWKQCQLYTANVLLDKLVKFKTENLDQVQIQVLIQSNSYNLEAIKKASSVAYAFALWIQGTNEQYQQQL